MYYSLEVTCTTLYSKTTTARLWYLVLLPCSVVVETETKDSRVRVVSVAIYLTGMYCNVHYVLSRDETNSLVGLVFALPIVLKCHSLPPWRNRCLSLYFLVNGNCRIISVYVVGVFYLLKVLKVLFDKGNYMMLF